MVPGAFLLAEPKLWLCQCYRRVAGLPLGFEQCRTKAGSTVYEVADVTKLSVNETRKCQLKAGAPNRGLRRGWVAGGGTTEPLTITVEQ